MAVEMSSPVLEAILGKEAMPVEVVSVERVEAAVAAEEDEVRKLLLGLPTLRCLPLVLRCLVLAKHGGKRFGQDDTPRVARLGLWFEVPPLAPLRPACELV